MTVKNRLNEEYFDIEVNDRKIYGVIHMAEAPKAIVISAHGLNGERVDAHRILVLFARKCAQNSIISVRFDFCGCGITEKEFYSSSISRRVEELKAVTECIRMRFPGIPIVLHGFSDGCRIVNDSFDLILPDAVMLWSPILLPSQAADANLDDIPWQRIPGEKWPVKPFLGLWLGFTYIKEYGRLKINSFEGRNVQIFKGETDASVNESIQTILEASKSLSCNKKEIPSCGHIYETHEATDMIINESISWIRSQGLS